ncbi:Uncharacterised protein [Mycobacteroides abscessus subsp. abscessus]|nr:Uncharacterised protein [Mycobacteroides abscessus subsp. abscessus]SIB77241.1 Uncharacterised protein [Mycobacteroides abscessus subsp. abscessus]SIC03006.1 Uncharacterised protein [Mycobacteroides abscessus subsp. abscessus]SID72613.1 Uncharacterised protein [Mycobacteroides abscessus subsp. abscessus]SIE99400.1 Uncharacterised protein [Mycobacteroides abscessus subsp. abscessus]
MTWCRFANVSWPPSPQRYRTLPDDATGYSSNNAEPVATASAIAWRFHVFSAFLSPPSTPADRSGQIPRTSHRIALIGCPSSRAETSRNRLGAVAPAPLSRTPVSQSSTPTSARLLASSSASRLTYRVCSSGRLSPFAAYTAALTDRAKSAGSNVSPRSAYRSRAAWSIAATASVHEHQPSRASRAASCRAMNAALRVLPSASRTEGTMYSVRCQGWSLRVCSAANQSTCSSVASPALAGVRLKASSHASGSSGQSAMGGITPPSTSLPLRSSYTLYRAPVRW